MMTEIILAALVGIVVGAAIVWFIQESRSKTRQAQLQAGQKEEVDGLQAQLTESEKTVASLEGKLEARENTEKFIAAAEDRMGQAFQAAAGKALESNNKQFINLANQNFETAMKGAKGELDKRHEKFQALVKPLADNYKALNLTIEMLTQQSQALAAETGKLSGALTDNRKAGHWGEVQLRKVAELANMTKYCDFAEQKGSGPVRPDMIVQLPDKRAIVVDAKASLSAFKEAQGEQDSEAFDATLRKHAERLRKQVDELAGKNYSEKVEGSLDFVAMFVPGDQFLAAALSAKPDLADYAIQKRIVLVTPASLIAMLWAVANGWQQQKIAANAEALGRAGEEMHKRIMTFMGHYQKVGKELEQAVDAFNKSIGSFDRSVAPQGRRFSQLVGKDEESLPAPDTIDALPRKSRYSGEDN